MSPEQTAFDAVAAEGTSQVSSTLSCHGSPSQGEVAVTIKTTPSEEQVKSFCFAPDGITLEVYHTKQCSWYRRSWLKESLSLGDWGCFSPPAWVRNCYSENSCVKHLISRTHNQSLTFKGTTPLHTSILKPLILPDSSASRTVSPTSELQQRLHLLLLVCPLVSRIPFTKQIKNCSLNFFSSQLYTSCSFAFFPRLTEAWPAKSFLTWKCFHIFIDILNYPFLYLFSSTMPLISACNISELGGVSEQV